MEPRTNENMKTEFMIVNRMLFVSSLELILPVFFQFHRKQKKMFPESAVILYIGMLFAIFVRIFHFISFYVFPELISVYSMNQSNSSPNNDNVNAPQMLGFVELGARRNLAQKMETKFLIGNRMLFASSLELILPVFFLIPS